MQPILSLIGKECIKINKHGCEGDCPLCSYFEPSDFGDDGYCNYDFEDESEELEDETIINNTNKPLKNITVEEERGRQVSSKNINELVDQVRKEIEERK